MSSDPADAAVQFTGTSSVRFVQRFVLNGCTELEVFGLPDPSKPLDGGACWVLRDYPIVEVLPSRIVCHRQGEKASCIRGGWKPEVLPWKRPVSQES